MKAFLVAFVLLCSKLSKIQGASCPTGVSGIANIDGDVCCPAACTKCGGSSCDTFPGGPSQCCRSEIVASGKLCSVTKTAPCVISKSTTSKPTTAKPTSKPTSASSSCGNGVAGYLSSDKKSCCPLGCTKCGGSDCQKLPLGSSQCCGGEVQASGKLCSVTKAAPCIVSSTTTAPTTAKPATAKPTSTPSTCGNGISGYLSSDKKACCPVGCTRCGGSACNKLPLGAANCCSGEVIASGKVCGPSQAAPCVIASATTAPTTAKPTSAATTGATTAQPTSPATSAATTATPTTASPDTSTCGNGVAGYLSSDKKSCCPLGCTKCGGSECQGLPLGPSQCCSGEVQASGKLCSVTKAAPCIVSATTTTAPTTAKPTTSKPTSASSSCGNGISGYLSLDKSACCPLGCTKCGGTNCQALPLGPTQCCTSEVVASGKKCSVTKKAPCSL